MPEAIKRIGVQFMKEPSTLRLRLKIGNRFWCQYYIRVKEGRKI